MRTTFNKTNTTIFLEGSLTRYNFSKFLETVQGIIKLRKCEIIVNCQDLQTIDSLGLGTIMSLAKSADKQGIDLYLIGLKGAIAASDTTNEIKEYVASVLDISNKVKAPNNAKIGAATFAPRPVAIKRV